MKYTLQHSLSKIVVIQFKDFIWYYLLAFISLVGTHLAQSRIPTLAKNLGELAVSSHLEKAPIKLYILIALCIIIFRTASRLLFFYPARVLQKNMRLELMDRFLHTRPSVYERINKGDLFQIIQTDVDQLRGYIGFALLQVGNAIICLSILIPQLHYFHPQLFYSIFPLFITMAIFSVVSVRNSQYFKKTADLQGVLQNVIIEAHQAKLTIKSFAAFESIEKVFGKHNKDETQAFLVAGLRSAIVTPLMGLGIGLSLVLGAYTIWSNGLRPSSFIYYSGIVFLINEPLSFFSWIGSIYSSAKAAMLRIHETIKLLDTPQLAKEVNQLEFGRNQEFIFTISFWNHPLQKIKIPFGEMTICVGPTGVGKSVILEQLAYNLKHHGWNVSFMPQLPHLFNDSIEANIFLAENSSSESKTLANKLLEIFGLSQFNLSTEVGENGKKLSGGQQKRIALIRSIISDAQVYIWDDPFDSIDIYQEKTILQLLSVENFFKGKTLILSTHRYSTFCFGKNYILLDKNVPNFETGLIEHVTQNKKGVYHFFEKQIA